VVDVEQVVEDHRGAKWWVEVYRGGGGGTGGRRPPRREW